MFRIQMRIRIFAVLVACLALPWAGCGGDEGKRSSNGGASQKPAPVQPVTKADVVAHLEGVLQAIQDEKWSDAAALFHFGERVPAEAKWPGVFQGMVQKSEISEGGIAILGEKGTFGPLQEVFPERGAAWSERSGVPLERCYGLSYDGAEVAVFSGDDGLKLIRLDDVGKLR